MEPKSLEPGDVVILKSGGPLMTVRYAQLAQGDVLIVHVTWFMQGHPQPEEAAFPQAMLTLVRPDVKDPQLSFALERAQIYYNP